MKDNYIVDLHYRQMGSNKAYVAHLDCVDKAKDLWTVWAEYGPSWSVVNKAGKIDEAQIPLEKAIKAYVALIKSKLKKGYTLNTSGINGRGIDELGQATEDAQLAFIYRSDLAKVSANPTKRKAL